MWHQPRATRAAPFMLSPRATGVALVLLVVTACGGGAPPPIPVIEPTAVLDGLGGVAHLQGLDLGRVIEQEPNDEPSLAPPLAPFWARCTFDVVGTLGVSAVHYGREDLVDAFRITCLSDQHITLDLTFTAFDPVDLQLNELAVDVREAESWIPIASASAQPGPISVPFDVSAGQPVVVAISIETGHAAYTARFEAEDPIGMQAPVVAPRRSAPVRPPLPMTALAHAVDPALDVAPGAPPCAATHVLVRLRGRCDPAAFCERRGLRLGRQLGTGSHVVDFDTAPGHCGRTKAVALCASLAADPDVEFADPDWIVKPLSTPNDVSFGRQWNMRMIGAPAAWTVEKGSPNVVVAVIDTGIIDHPDLEGQTVPGYDFISDPAIAADGDGRDPDPTDRGDGFDGSGLSTWHGTAVASIVAAKQDDGHGISGVAPGCKVMPVRVLGIGGGYVSDAADAVLYCAGRFTTETGHRVPIFVAVINLSLGLPQDSPDLRDACQRAADSGCLLVAAVGNDGQNVLYPAGYSSVVGVAAVDGEFDVTAYSAPGDGVAIAAPGGLHVADRWLDGWMDGVLSCVRDETGDEPEYAHHYLVGTSQAAPHVAGAAALMLSANPGLLPSEVRTLLRASALDRGAVGDDVGYGAGVLQVHRAVNLALSANGTPRQDPPTLFLPTTSLNFDGFRSTSITYLYNGGSGQLQPTDVLVETDDGFPWLSATLLDSSRINPPVTRDRVQVDVNRFIVPPGRYAGVVRIRSAAGVLGTIRVVMQVGGYTRLGMPITVSALERDSLIARGEDVAVAERSYRYFVRGMPANDYLLRGGEDFDGDGFLCESFEACGWHDSPLQEEAVAVPFVPGVPAVRGLRVMLAPQQP